MGDIWLSGLPPAHTDYAKVHALTSIYWSHDDAIIMAGIAGNESGYDWRVINDTPGTGDYSVGLFQINYYNGLYSERVRLFGTPRDLIMAGPSGQVQAARQLWLQAGGFSPWQADITNNLWQKWVGSGPVPNQPGQNVPQQPLPHLPPARKVSWDEPIRRTADQVVTVTREMQRAALTIRNFVR